MSSDQVISEYQIPLVWFEASFKLLLYFQDNKVALKPLEQIEPFIYINITDRNM